MKLYESERTYYCTEEGGYEERYKSFDDFLDNGNPRRDKDLNLLFRWDWKEDVLVLHYFLQRKGVHSVVFISVTQEDEPLIREFLFPHWEHIKALWNPISES